MSTLTASIQHCTSGTNNAIRKEKESKQEEQRQNHGYGQCFDGCQMGVGLREMGEEMKGLRSTNKQLQNRHRDVKYHIGNEATKELTHMTHGCEQWCGDSLREWRCWVEGNKGRKSGQL